jgi:hypothetical protein
MKEKVRVLSEVVLVVVGLSVFFSPFAMMAMGPVFASADEAEERGDTRFIPG